MQTIAVTVHSIDESRFSKASYHTARLVLPDRPHRVTNSIESTVTSPERCRSGMRYDTGQTYPYVSGSDMSPGTGDVNLTIMESSKGRAYGVVLQN